MFWWADPGERARIQYLGRRHATIADIRGRWFVAIVPFVAGGPYEMSVERKSVTRLYDILVGDVWLASRQSNMEFTVKANG